MPSNDQIKVQTGKGKTFFANMKPRRLDVRGGLRKFYDAIPSKLRTILIVLACSAAGFSLALFILSSPSTSPEKKHLPKEAIITQTGNRLHSLVTAIVQLRD